MSVEHDPSPDPWQVTRVDWDLVGGRLTVITPAVITRFARAQDRWLMDLNVQDPAVKRQLLQAWMAELTGATEFSSDPEPERAPDHSPEDGTVVSDVASPESPSSSSQESNESSTKNPTLILAGKLQTAPREGRPDRQGKPTAWARFLGHVPEHEGAVLFSATFHGRTRELALGLQVEDPVTAQGYVHWHRPSSPEDRRLSTFSVIHLLQYPGKP